MYQVGDRVRQAYFGNGTVTVIDAFHITIDFDIRGERTFLTSRVQLTPATEPAPAELRAQAQAAAERTSGGREVLTVQ